MYPRPKKTVMSWALDVFVALTVLLLIGVLAVGLYLSKEGRSLMKSGQAPKGSPLQRQQ